MSMPLQTPQDSPQSSMSSAKCPVRRAVAPQVDRIRPEASTPSSTMKMGRTSTVTPMITALHGSTQAIQASTTIGAATESTSAGR